MFRECSIGAITTSISPDSPLAEVNIEQVKAHIREHLLKIGDKFIGQKNTPSTRQAVAHVYDQFIREVYARGYTLMDENNLKIIEGSIVIRGDQIIMPRGVRMLTKRELHNEIFHGTRGKG